MGDEMRAAKKRRIMDNIITITVGGDDGEKFMIHDFLLKENSKFFEAALNRQWKEGQEKKVALPDDDPEVFAVYAGWLFTGKIATRVKENLDEPLLSDIDIERKLHAKLYVLGEKLIDDKFCDCTLQAMSETGIAPVGGKFYHPGSPIIRIIYEGTTDKSPIRKYLVDIYLQHGHEEWFNDKRAPHYPHDFLVDLVKKRFSTSPTLAVNTRLDIGPYLKSK